MSDEKKEVERVFVLHECDAHKIVKDEEGDVRVVNRMTEGQALPQEHSIVRFEEVEGHPGYADMVTIHRSSGPAKVNNQKYRSGWDSIFGKKPSTQKDLN